VRWVVASIQLVGLASACRGGAAATDAPAPDPAVDAIAGAIDGPAASPDAPDAPPAIDASTAPDADPGVPDLVVVRGKIEGTAQISNEFFSPSSCEVAEGCVGDFGSRRLLRFDAVTANLGTGDLVLGPVPPAGVSAGPFIWSSCHHHHHVPSFEDYALVGPDGVVIAGHKQSYCLRDDEREVTGAPTHGYTCANQGISAGWSDVYLRSLPCQWIDITGVAPGVYTLRVTVNPLGTFPDSDPSNDSVDVTVVL
jgi:hypothetical protein